MSLSKLDSVLSVQSSEPKTFFADFYVTKSGERKGQPGYKVKGPGIGWRGVAAKDAVAIGRIFDPSEKSDAFKTLESVVINAATKLQDAEFVASLAGKGKGKGKGKTKADSALDAALAAE